MGGFGCSAGLRILYRAGGGGPTAADPRNKAAALIATGSFAGI